jgi:hypothetical protein
MSGHIEDDKKAADRREAIGALSRIDGATVLRSLAIPTEGRLLDLGLELGQATAHHPAFVRFTLAFTQTPEGTGAMSEATLLGIPATTAAGPDTERRRSGRFWGVRCSSIFRS